MGNTEVSIQSIFVAFEHCVTVRQELSVGGAYTAWNVQESGNHEGTLCVIFAGHSFHINPRNICIYTMFKLNCNRLYITSLSFASEGYVY